MGGLLNLYPHGELGSGSRKVKIPAGLKACTDPPFSVCGSTSLYSAVYSTYCSASVQYTVQWGYKEDLSTSLSSRQHIRVMFSERNYPRFMCNYTHNIGCLGSQPSTADISRHPAPLAIGHALLIRAFQVKEEG